MYESWHIVFINKYKWSKKLGENQNEKLPVHPDEFVSLFAYFWLIELQCNTVSLPKEQDLHPHDVNNIHSFRTTVRNNTGKISKILRIAGNCFDL